MPASSAADPAALAMLYVFRWRCLDQPVALTVSVDAPTDKQAGDLAAAALHDFAKGRLRELRWEPQVPLTRTPARH